MTFNDLNKKVTEAVEVFGGHIAMGALLTIITGITAWMLSVEIEQGKQLATLIGLSEGRNGEFQSVHSSIEKLSDEVHNLELSVTSIRQELNDNRGH